jgi:hypothetical protein
MAAKDQEKSPNQRQHCIQHGSESVSASLLTINRLRSRLGFGEPQPVPRDRTQRRIASSHAVLVHRLLSRITFAFIVKKGFADPTFCPIGWIHHRDSSSRRIAPSIRASRCLTFSRRAKLNLQLRCCATGDPSSNGFFTRDTPCSTTAVHMSTCTPRQIPPARSAGSS